MAQLIMSFSASGLTPHPGYVGVLRLTLPKYRNSRRKAPRIQSVYQQGLIYTKEDIYISSSPPGQVHANCFALLNT